MLCEDTIKKITFLDAYMGEEYMLVSNNAFNGLFQIKLDNWEAKFLCFFEHEQIGQSMLHNKVISYRGKVYFTPYKAKGMSVYHLETQKMKYYTLEPVVGSLPQGYMVEDALLLEDKILLFPTLLKYPVVSFYLKDHTYEVEQKLTDILRNLVYATNRKSFTGVHLIKDNIWIAMSYKNILISINKNDFTKVEIHEVDIKDIWASYKKDEELWITVRQEPYLFRFYTGSGKIIKTELDNEISKEMCGNYKLLELPEKIGILPMKTVRRLKAEKCERQDDDFWYLFLSEENMLVDDFRKKWNKYGASKVLDDKGFIMFCPSNTETVLCINRNTSEIMERKIALDESTIDLRYILYEKKHIKIDLHQSIRENEENTLSVFLNNIWGGETLGTYNISACGGMIYNVIKGNP